MTIQEARIKPANKRIAKYIAVAFALLLPSGTILAQDAPLTAEFFESYCTACHGDACPEGAVSLNALQAQPFEQSTDTWTRVLEALRFGEMPPASAEQPKVEEVEQLAAWITNRLRDAGVESDVEHKLRQPAYANLINHERLFDGSFEGRAASPPRLWRIHPFAYDNFLLGFGRELNVGGPLSKPFTVGDGKGEITDYATLMQADSATLEQLMLNCRQIADLQTIGFKREEKDRRTQEMVERHFYKPPASFAAIIDGDDPVTAEQLAAAVKEEFEIVLNREPNADESRAYADLLSRSIEIGGKKRGLRTMAMAVLLRPEAIYRMEVGLGETDAAGRRMLSPYELAYAVSYALTDSPPNQVMLGPLKNRRPQGPSLIDLANSGQLKSREDVRRVVAQIWDSPHIEKPRILRFFQEFFGYHAAETVFKGDRAGKEFAPKHLIRDADDLITHIIQMDRDVLKELLTTERFSVYAVASPEEYERRIKYITGRIKPENKKDRNYNYFVERTARGLRPMPQANPAWRQTVRFYNLDPETWEYPVEQPFAMTAGERCGILTHPAWLAAWSGNFDNDPIRRGKWIREHLLADSVPDVPITVDAIVPEDPHKTLRERLTKTQETYCWTCHQKMDPLGLPFEAYDDFGRFRTSEGLGLTKALREPKRTAPVDSQGEIIDSGDALLDGKVKDVHELMHRLAESDRVRQSFVRHAFRYWMGRNEMMSDSPTLMAADTAYLESEGSFRALVISLLTSDSFLYRK